ncbi:zinc finger protein 664 isoform X3 [Microcebus murinus]|uniref:zinc finger protein 664 isoform X3 n=1 Tax=Microcebus murinus TaxID=30608 RepID=UPI003F6B456E
MGGAAAGGAGSAPALPRPAAEGGQWAPPAPRIPPAPTRAPAAVHPGSGRRRGLAALTLRTGVRAAGGRGGGGSPRPGRGRRASRSGDEEPSAHPAQKAAAAGRLHCLTTTRAGRILTQDPKAFVALQPLWALSLPLLECFGGLDFCHCAPANAYPALTDERGDECQYPALPSARRDWLLIDRRDRSGCRFRDGVGF